MTRLFSPLRFFHVVRTQPPLIVWTFGVLVVVGGTAILRDPTRADGVILPVILLQLFAASSGFEVPARRGHYDLLLTSGQARVWIALVHWASSIAPGVISWLALAVAEIGVSRGGGHQLLATGSITAMALVSVLPWALTIRLPRYSGGIGWLLVLALSTGVWPSAQAWPAWRVLVYPVVLVGRDLSVNDALVAGPALFLSMVAMLMACRWVSRASVPLEAAQ